MRVGVDLLWVRPGKNGGTESYIRNLLEGFRQSDTNQVYVLFVSSDNCESFKKYTGSQFEIVICPVNTSCFVKRVIWENIKLKNYVKDQEIDVWFFPVYSRPFAKGMTPSVTVIHDLQALHFPSYFSWIRNAYFRLAWRKDCKKSTRVVTISDFCRNDIVKNYHVNPQKVMVIYNPIIAEDDSSNFDSIAKKYNIVSGNYYYTVSSLAKHKNLMTLLHAIKILKAKGYADKLVISGVKVNAESEIFEYIKQNQLEDMIVYTGFISNMERNALYDNCKKFLFPSVFEGFGMPPVEAIIRGIPVLTTKETSLFEVTEGCAEYVNNPYDADEWQAKMVDTGIKSNDCSRLKGKYDIFEITTQYQNLFDNVASANE